MWVLDLARARANPTLYLPRALTQITSLLSIRKKAAAGFAGSATFWTLVVAFAITFIASCHDIPPLI